MEIKVTLLKLTNTLEWIERASAFGEMDIEYRQILRFIAKHNVINQEVCATDIIQNKEIAGSQVTQIRRIKFLKYRGWIKGVPSKQHHKKISLVLTEKGIDDLNFISNMLENELGVKYTELDHFFT
jgi:DNA-binding MarR family transcriptional regulator